MISEARNVCVAHGDNKLKKQPSHKVVENVAFAQSPPGARERLNYDSAKSIGKHSTREQPSHQVVENEAFEHSPLYAAKKTIQTTLFWGHCGAARILMVLKETITGLQPGSDSAQTVPGGNEHYSL